MLPLLNNTKRPLKIQCYETHGDNINKILFPHPFDTICVGIVFVDVNNGAYYQKLVSCDKYGFIKQSIRISDGSIFDDMDGFKYIAIGY